MTAKEAKETAMRVRTMSWADAAYLTLQKDISIAANAGAVVLNRILNVELAEKGEVTEVVERLRRDGFDVGYKSMGSAPTDGQFKISWE